MIPPERFAKTPFAAAAMLLLLLAGCGLGADRPLQMPDAADAAERYGAGAEAEVRGNLLEVRLAMSQELLRGGGLWVRSGPYFYLFSPPTRDLFAEYPDLAAIRVVMHTPGGEEVARAELRRDALTEPRWREALFRSAVAQRDGTERPRTLEDLTFFGEDHTDFRYSPEYVRQ
jgi:predicted small lipoprotein YifL